MRPPLRVRAALGSTMLLVMILLGVLAAVGAAAVTMASRDRINASAKTRRDMLVSCAQAAQAKIWAELASHGPNYFTSSATAMELTLADGTRLGPLHYDQSAGISISQVIVKNSTSCDQGDKATGDMTNTMGTGRLNCTDWGAFARCTLPSRTGGPDSQLEVEFVIRTRL